MIKKCLITLMSLVLVIVIASCSSGGHYYDENLDIENKIEELASSGNTVRKIIITSKYEIETTDLSKSVKDFTKQVANSDGYVESSNVYKDSASFVFRIPSIKLDAFISFTENSGNITYSSQQGKDVTIEYHDTESELRTLKVQEERLLELLKESDHLADILTLEEKLTETRTKIDKISTRLNELDNLIDYSKVEIYLTHVEAYSKKDFGTLIKNSFTSSINFGLNILKYASVVVIWLSPYIAIAGVIIIIILFVRKTKKNED